MNPDDDETEIGPQDALGSALAALAVVTQDMRGLADDARQLLYRLGQVQVELAEIRRALTKLAARTPLAEEHPWQPSQSGRTGNSSP